MTDHERFWSIAAQLRADRRWAGRIRRIGVTGRLACLGLRAISLMEPGVMFWVL
jgi:hypothetical protein